MDDYLLWGALAGVVGLVVVWLAIRRKPKAVQRAPRVEVAPSVQASLVGPPSIDTVSAAYRPQTAGVNAAAPAPRLPGEGSREAAEAAAREAADREAAEWEAQLLAQYKAHEEAHRAEQPSSAASPPTLSNAVSAEDSALLRLQREEQLQAEMDREAAEFAARIEAERIASEAPTLQPPYAADELRLQDESTAAITALHPPTLTDVMAEVLPDAIPEVAAGLVDGDGPPSTVPADDGAAARREAAARLARERAEREAAEAEAWLDEQRRADETRRAQAETDASALAETPPDIDAFTAQLEVPPRQTEEERYAEVERQTSDLVARVNAQRLAVDVLGVVPSLGIELEFPAVPGLEGLEAAAASSRITTPADALSTDDFPRVELDFAAPTLDGNEFADPEVSPTPDPIAEALAFDAKPAASAAAAPTELPLAASADNPPPVEQASPRRTTDQFVVMVADDSKVVRVKTSRLLLKQGYQVLLAEDGLDAMRQIALRVPDVLITDVEMPGLDGFGLTRQVRADVRSAHIPIVMITADDDKHRVAATGAGVSVLLSKPYPEDHLLAWLEEALGCTVAVMG